MLKLTVELEEHLVTMFVILSILRQKYNTNNVKCMTIRAKTVHSCLKYQSNLYLLGQLTGGISNEFFPTLAELLNVHCIFLN